jgi:Tfp pilus assembly protein PilF
MISVLLAAALAGATPPVAAPVQPLSEAAHAIRAGRLEQARLMINNAVKAGISGPALERVIADLAYASGDYQDALPRYLRLLVSNPNDGVMYEQAGIAAMKVGDHAQGAKLLERAVTFPGATWKGWNARGVAADYQRDWAVADRSYARAAALAPNRAEILNNSGWSLLARGRWAEALQNFERAAAIDPKSPRIAANLELARAALSEELPERRAGETEADWAARLNDAGVIARLQGNNKKAVAAFTRAIQARSEYYDRAANNLASAQVPR